MSTITAVPENPSKLVLQALPLGHSTEVVLPGENRDAYNAFGAALVARYQPASEEAHSLIRLLQDTQWRLDRTIAIGCNILVLATTEKLDSIDPTQDETVRHCLAQAAAYREHARVLDQIQRRENHLLRLANQARAHLEQLTSSAAAVPAPASSATPAANRPDSGFVPNIPTFTGPMADIKRKQWLRKNGHAVR